MRKYSTNIYGQEFSFEIKLAVWKKGAIVPCTDQTKLRKDFCSALIEWYFYGIKLENGWEIDHIIPVSKGGTDELNNLQLLHWQNNRAKGDDYPPKDYCKVKSY